MHQTSLGNQLLPWKSVIIILMHIVCTESIALVWEGIPLTHQLQDACRKLVKGVGYKINHNAQEERAAVTVFYYRKLMYKGKISHWISTHIWKKYTKCTRIKKAHTCLSYLLAFTYFTCWVQCFNLCSLWILKH